MPWKPHFTKEEAQRALAAADSWAGVLRALGYRYHGKNIATVRKWAARWGLATDHLTDHRGRRGRPARYTDAELRAAVAASKSWAETLRRLGYCPTGGNPRTLQKRTAELGIPIDHFDPYAAARRPRPELCIPLEDILIEGSTYSRTNLKRRLYEAGLKERRCELCGQTEMWRGKRITLILDHINGVRDDNRVENLRIICPNCAATLDTHCGRNGRDTLDPRACIRCEKQFVPRYRQQRVLLARVWDAMGPPRAKATEHPAGRTAGSAAIAARG